MLPNPIVKSSFESLNIHSNNSFGNPHLSCSESEITTMNYA